MVAARRPLAALLAVLVLAGCGSSAERSSGPASSATVSAAGAPAAGPHDDADVAFATMMLPHHQQAVQMSDVLLAKTGVAGDVRDLATRIKAEQTPEIAQMTGWLQGWGAPVPSGMADMGGHDGMMSQADMDALETADGAQAQALFLREMVGHHEGAVAMAKTELASGQNAEAKTLASSIIGSQQAEIAEMNALLDRR